MTESQADLQAALTACKEPDCQEAGAGCFYPDNETNVANAFYCFKHAAKHGFCWGCGLFWGGCESFDFAEYRGRPSSLCENCGQVDDEHELDEESFEDDLELLYD